MKNLVDIRAKKQHPLAWLVEPLQEQTGYFRRTTFGCESAYLNGKLVLVLADGEEPWNGMMVATSHEHHASLKATWKELKSHPVLGKWMYISQENPTFEKVATAVVQSVKRGDARIGVEPKPRKRKKTTRIGKHRTTNTERRSIPSDRAGR